MSEYLYLIRCRETHKIGVATDVRSRIASLQTGNPYKLELVDAFWFPNAELVERVLHQKYAEYRTLGEWFEIPNVLIGEFRQICEMLGGVRSGVSNGITEEEIEEAEETQEALELQPTIEDVKKIMNDPAYRLEYRYNENGLRGFAWRLRTGNKECPLYIGKRSPIFEEVRRMLPEHKGGSE